MGQAKWYNEEDLKQLLDYRRFLEYKFETKNSKITFEEWKKLEAATSMPQNLTNK